MKNRIYYTKPSIIEIEVKYATDAARNGWGEHCYEYITRFEETFREHMCVKHVIELLSTSQEILL